MSGVPIPDDWDGVSYECYSLQWPNSLDWQAILYGLISYPTRGRYWDADSGSITGAQAVGQNILMLNSELEVCIMSCGSVEDFANALAAALNCGPGVSGGCVGGTNPITQPAIDVSTPPLGWDDTGLVPNTGDYINRKCKMANLIVDQIRGWIGAWDNLGVDDYIGSGLIGATTFAALATILGAAIGEIVTPVPIVDGFIGGVAGFIAGIAAVIVANSFDLTNLVALLDSERGDLVCAFMESTSFDQAKEDYITVLENAGAQTGAILLLRAVLVADLLNWLFFNSGLQAIDTAAFDSYVPPDDCSSCDVACVIIWPFESGFQNWVPSDLSSGGGSSTISHDGAGDELDFSNIMNGPNQTAGTKLTLDMPAGHDVSPGDTMKFELGPQTATNGANLNISYNCEIFLVGGGSENKGMTVAGNNTFTLTYDTASGEIDFIEFRITNASASNPTGFTKTGSLRSLELSLAASPSCFDPGV